MNIEDVEQECERSKMGRRKRCCELDQKEMTKSVGGRLLMLKEQESFLTSSNVEIVWRTEPSLATAIERQRAESYCPRIPETIADQCCRGSRKFRSQTSRRPVTIGELNPLNMGILWNGAWIGTRVRLGRRSAIQALGGSICDATYSK